MAEENRQNVRYEEIGRVISPELCALPGILDNISATGCRVHFPVNVIVDLESEFDVKISLSRSPEESPLQLLCKPQWVKECKNTTQIGLTILYSPDAVRLNEFISSLQELSESPFPEIV